MMTDLYEPISLEDIAFGIDRIKPLSQTVLGLIRSIDDEGATSVNILTDKICTDQPMMARILRAANSPIYGIHGHITSIKEAVTVLGYRSLRSLAIALTLDGCFTDVEDFKTQPLWNERFFVAFFAHHVAPLIHLGRDTAYLIGLLYDIGKLVLYSLYPDRYRVTLELSQQKGIRFSKAERALFGFDYSRVGTMVCDRWKVPFIIKEAIEQHLRSQVLAPNYALLIAAGLSLFELTAKMPFEAALAEKIANDPIFSYLGLTQEICEKRLIRLPDDVQQTMAILAI